MTQSALAFRATSFDVVDQSSQPWLRANQIGLALEYKNPELSIAKLYRANAAEFTDSMTAVVKLPTAGGVQDVRIFSLRGAHLLGMFARTKVAADFRRWVLDVLDAQVQQAALPPATLTPAQQQQLKAAIEAKCKGDGRAYSQCYRALYEAFHVPSYKDVPASQFEAALSFVADWQYQPGPIVPVGQYETLNELVARLARQLAEPNGYCVVTFMPLYEVICQKLGHSPRYVERLPELLADPGFDIEPQLLSQINQASHQRLMQKLSDAYEGMDMLGTAIRRIKGPRPKALPA